MSNTTHKYKLEDLVIDKGTGIRGKVVMCGSDEHGLLYHVDLEKRIEGRRRHTFREAHLKAAPKAKKG